ncbi:hypothetical protein ACFSUS_08120 [Spirosoma soli]|uniref:DUF5666 domain-containing protein n=1 Tax=Spirosoma soli TaxID=1770529 RepID=A0ABW5M1S4_9BACT
METNAKVICMALLGMGLWNVTLQAQPVPPIPPNASVLAGPTPPLPGQGEPLDQPVPPGPQGRRGPKPGALIPLTTITGAVQQLSTNDDFVFDGFMLNAGSGIVTVKFPPHLGQQIQKLVKTGTTVSVTGTAETSPRGESTFHMNSLTAGKTTVLDAPPTEPVTPPVETLTNVSGKITDYRVDREGRVNGFVLDDKTVIRVPGHAAYQLTNLATKGTSISVQGYPKTIRNGQVQLEKVNIVRASVVTINGQQYLVR